MLFSELVRVTKPGGLIYINAPSNGPVHRYPVDCWRFYPDSGFALQNWARRNGYELTLLNSSIGAQGNDYWNDFVAVFACADFENTLPTQRMLDQLSKFNNGWRSDHTERLNESILPEDQKALSMRLRRKFSEKIGAPL